MSLFLMMLPVYLLGNLHCMGMCGPLVMLLGKHRWRMWYFVGRLSSFSLAAGFAAGAGTLLTFVLKKYHISESLSLLLGSFIISWGICHLFSWKYPGQAWLGKRLEKSSKNMSLLLLKDKPESTFLFGFFTVLLPCGQTVIVFSACALSGDITTGLANGAAFALLTSPSLFFAMQAHLLLKKWKSFYRPLMGGASIFVGGLALCRGLADLGWLPHLVLNQNYHIVLY